MSGHGMTGVLGRIADAAGPAAALKLARELGGLELKLSARPGGKLARLVGVEAARALVEEFGPSAKITVPMGPVRGQRGRREAAARLLATGLSTGQTARRVDVHERTVRRIRGSAAGGAGPLFEDRSED